MADVFSDFTFVVCHPHIGISQLALVHALVHVHVRRSGSENFRADLLDYPLLGLLVNLVDLRETLELK